MKGMTMHYLLFYDVVPDYPERRAKFRKVHLDLCWEACSRGELIHGRALADPADGAVLLFQGDSSEVTERFAAADFFRNGLIARWRV